MFLFNFGCCGLVKYGSCWGGAFGRGARLWSTLFCLYSNLYGAEIAHPHFRLSCGNDFIPQASNHYGVCARWSQATAYLSILVGFYNAAQALHSQDVAEENYIRLNIF